MSYSSAGLHFLSPPVPPPPTHNAHILSHPRGSDPLWPQAPSLPSPPGKHRLLAEEGTWDAMTARNPVGCAGLTRRHRRYLGSLSQGFDHKRWTLPTWRTKGWHTFWSLDPLPFPRQLAQPYLRSEPSLLSRKTAGSPPFYPRVRVPAGAPRNWALGTEGAALEAVWPVSQGSLSPPSYMDSNWEKHASIWVALAGDTYLPCLLAASDSICCGVFLFDMFSTVISINLYIFTHVQKI